MTFRNRLTQDRILVAPGVFNALFAHLAERAGFEALYLSGASIAYTRLGGPDIGLVSLAEVVDVLASIREKTALPIIVDADTGFGNALNVQRTVSLMERAASGGSLAIQLEDQTFPKRCGHLDGKGVVPKAEMVGKIQAAVDARRDRDTLIVARTDAVAVEGLEPALERAEAYREAGADVLFIEALRSREQIVQATGKFRGRAPLLANMVEGGKTPLLPADELEKLGYSIVIWPGGLVRALSRSAQEYFAALKRDGTTASLADRMLDFDGLNGLLGTADVLACGKRYE